MMGVILFLVGMIINIHSDSVLRNLRKPGEQGYKIPRGMIIICCVVIVHDHQNRRGF